MYVVMNDRGEYLSNSTRGFGPVEHASLFTATVVTGLLRVLNCAAVAIKVNEPRRKQAGFALLAEMLIVTVVMLVLAAASIPSFIQLRATANQQEARGAVLRTYNANAAITVCAAEQGCVSTSALLAQIPQPGTVITTGYRFTYTANADGTWLYSATPIQPAFSGHTTYLASPNGFCTQPQGGTITCLQ